jgi:DNA-binding SARP family transcriptional activator
MSLVDITLLGAFSVHVDGSPVADQAWHRRAASDVVKLLALSDGRALHREQVADLLWPRLPLGSAMPRLHQAAHYARSGLGLRDGVVLHHDRVLLLPEDDVRVDAVELRRRAEEALRNGSSLDAERILADFSGELLPGDLYAEWISTHRAALDALRDRLVRLAGAAASPTGSEPRPRLAEVGRHGHARGLLLVIDDLAGADAASLRLLRHVAASITARGIGRVLEIG